jgi:hypothetical protein
VNRSRFLLLILLLVAATMNAQRRTKEERKVHRDSMMTFWNTQDTNFVRKYPDRFIFTWSASYREYSLDFAQTLTNDTLNFGHPTMKGSTSTSYGGAIDFDKISFSFGLGAKEISDAEQKQRGKTDYSAYNFSFSAYRFRVESSYRRLHGMYDTKSRNYDTLYFDSTGIYWQNPTMDIRSMRVKTLFIFNKRHFSYNSAYYNTQRQLKSSGSLLLINNIYNYRFKADSFFLSPAARPFFGDWGNLNYFSASGISIGPGFSYNLVIWKTLYANATVMSGFDFQHRNYNANDGTHLADYWHIGYAGDLRLAFGLNGKRMFSSFTFRWDLNNYIGDGFRITPTFFAIDFNIGYRFPFKERKWVKKMKANKWYQML